MGSRGMGASTRGGGAVMSGRGGQSSYKTGGAVSKPKFADGGAVSRPTTPRAGTQGVAKRGYKKGGLACEDGRVKKALGGVIGNSMGTPGAGQPGIGALQNQGAVIGVKKRKKMTKLGTLKAPSAPQASPAGAQMSPMGPNNVLP